MSAEAIRTAVRDRLREQLQVKDSECELQPRANPPQSATGILYISIHPGSRTSNNRGGGHYHDHNIGVNVTVSMKVGHVPQDRWGQYVINRNDPDNKQSPSESTERLVDYIVGLIHGNYDVVTAANALIEDDTSAFVEPLRVSPSIPGPVVRYPDWWGAKSVDDQRPGSRKIEPRLAGVSQTISFDNARRIQTIGENWP